MSKCEKQGEQPIDADEVDSRIVLEVECERISKGSSDMRTITENIRSQDFDKEIPDE